MFSRTKQDTGIVLYSRYQCFLCQTGTPGKGNTTRLNLLEIGLIPEHWSLVILRTKQIYHLVKEIALQLPVLRTVGCGNTQFLLQCLALRTVGPTVERRISCLITTQMDIFRRKDICQLLEYITQELISEVITRTKQLIRYTAGGTDRFLNTLTGQLRINTDGSYLVTRHLNLRNYLDMILGAVCHEVAHLLLGIIALDRHQHIVHSPSAARLGGESRIFLDFDGPSLVIYEMEMKHIQFIAGHLRNKSLQILVWNEDAARIHHQFSHMGARLVFQSQLRDGITTYLRGVATEQLVESHQTIEDTSSSLTLDNYSLLLHIKGISLIVCQCLIQGKRHSELSAFFQILMLLYPLLQDSLGMFLLIGKPIGSNDFPVSCHLQRCCLGIYFQVHRSRNQTSLRIADSSRLFHLTEEVIPSRSLAIEFFATSWHHQFHASHIHARKSSRSCLWRNLGVHLDDLYAFQIGKGKLSQLRRSVYRDVFQCLATRKGCSSHFRHALRNHYILQMVTGKESLTANLLQLVWQDDALQMMTGMKGILWKNGTGSLT